jgi:hypothetical protein
MQTAGSDATRIEPAAAAAGPRWISFAIGALAFLAALVLGLRTLYHAHPNEDAYILFKYADQLAAGHGIVYYPGGPHAEGATDFLWMVALACARRIGCDVALAAVIGNAIGAGLLAFLCARELLDRSGGWLGVLGIAFVITGPAFAAYLGFSALLYSALAAWTFRRTLAALWNERSSTAIPWLALVLALFRPDGLILGAGFACVGFVAARRRAELSRYARAAGGAFLVALTYAIWRRWYFGLALPLPLYVKSPVAAASGGLASKLPGLESNLSWSTAWDGPLPLLIGVVVLMFLARARKPAIFAFVVCLLPALLHLVALSFARQTQNFLDRFQGPELAVAFVSVFVWAGRAHSEGASATKRILACCVGALGVVPTIWVGAQHLPRVWGWNGGYIDSFAYEMGHILEPKNVLALTEAGRLSFWTDATVVDVVGLNSPDTAVKPPTVDTLRAIDPDVLLFYAGQFHLKLHIADPKPVVAIPREMLPASVGAEFGAAFRSDDPHVLDALTPENRATIVMGRFAFESGAYDLFAGMNVLERPDTRNYSHVFGIRRTLPQHDALVKALEATANGEVSITYAQAAGLPFAKRWSR